MIIVFFSFFHAYLQYNAVHGGSGTASLIRPWEESQIATGHHNPTGVLFQIFRCPVEVQQISAGRRLEVPRLTSLLQQRHASISRDSAFDVSDL